MDLNSAALGTGRHANGIANPFNGHIDAFRISHVQRYDGWIATTWDNMSDPGASAAAGAEGWNKTREYRSLVDELAEEVSARLQRTIGTSAAAPGLRGDLPPHGQRDES